MNIDWNSVIAIAGVLASALGLNHLKDRAVAKANDWKNRVIAKAKQLATEIAGKVNQGVIAGERAVVTWEQGLEGWVTAEAGKLPPALRKPALEAAHAVFTEVHTYMTPAIEKAVQTSVNQLAVAVANFQRELVKMRPDLDKLEKTPAKT